MGHVQGRERSGAGVLKRRSTPRRDRPAARGIPHAHLVAGVLEEEVNMCCRNLVSLSSAASVVAIMLLTPAPAAGQAATASASSAAADQRTPRTPWGDPDLQGLWTSETSTPFERPERFAGKPFLTAAEVAALEAEARANQLTERPVRDGDPGTYNQIWFDRGTAWVRDRRTSLIVGITYNLQESVRRSTALPPGTVGRGAPGPHHRSSCRTPGAARRDRTCC